MAHGKQDKTMIVKDGDARERVITIKAEKNLPTRIVKTPKKITVHSRKAKGHKGKAMPMKNKKYPGKSKGKQLVIG